MSANDELPEWARDKDPDELVAILESFVDLFRKRHEREVLTDAESQFAEMPSLRWPPMPMTAHPALKHCAESVRRVMNDGVHTVQIPKPRRMASWLLKPLDEELDDPRDDITTLTIRKAWAPAPYVGEPYVIAWKVALDGSQRWVAGESWIQHTQPRLPL